MSNETNDTIQGKKQYLSLRNLYLDPNNYRFRDHTEYREIDEKNITNKDVQRRTSGFVLGKSAENVTDLIDSLRENGWLEIGPILVRRLQQNSFVVVEGNRRVATLKYLKHRYKEDAIDLGRLDPERFTKVPVMLYDDADEQHYLVMMGLHHISGKRRWPAINRAEAMKRLYEHFGKNGDAVCRALGVSKREFNLSVRTLALVDLYKKSDFGDQFEAEKYNLLREVLTAPSIREWLDWNERDETVGHQHNLERLFSWVSKDIAPENESDENASDINQYDLEPAITTGAQMRELAKVIEDPNAVKRLEETRSLQEATLSSDLLIRNEIDGAFTNFDRSIEKLNKNTGKLTEDHLDNLEELMGKLQGLALARKRQPVQTMRRLDWKPFNEMTRAQFTHLEIEAYRSIRNLSLEEPGRINIIAGLNNAGKTSLLEAIYLLTRQHDERALLDLIQWRARIAHDPDPLWLVEQLPELHITGNFDDYPESKVSLDIKTSQELPEGMTGDLSGYLCRMEMRAQYAGQNQHSQVTFFADRPRRTTFHGQHWLCRSAFTSPFVANRPQTLEASNEKSMEAGTKDRIIQFICEHVDPKLEYIEMVGEFKRFIVKHQSFAEPPDLSSFGDGLRRIFELGLMFANVRGGVLFIDEFENALHQELLVSFTRFVQELAQEMNVQVFLTTHSKETINAFLDNNFNTQDIVGYAVLPPKDQQNTVKRFSGEHLLKLKQAIGFDLRGVR